MIFAPLIDRALVRLFRFRTRGFLQLQECDGAVPPRPANGDCTLYVHVPFCEVLCPFCSFHRVQHCHAQAVRYFAALRREIALYADAGYQFTGVYFGGGTPTVEPDELAATIAFIRARFAVRELSVETNPHDLRPDLLARLHDLGVTRLSVGVQSFDDDLLREMQRLERYGTGDQIIAHLERAAGLFPTLNVDLIFNQPHQTVASLQRDLAIVRGSGVNQVSCYPLMTSPSVERRMDGAMGTPDPGRLRSLYTTIVRELSVGFRPTSAWCFTRTGQTGDEYIVAADHYVGVGSGAFSFLDGTLYATTFSLRAYEARLNDGRTGIMTSHALSETDRMRYALLVRMFGLRLDRTWAHERHGAKFFRRLWGELRTLEWLGAARRDPSGWQLTERGMFWLMLMMSEFFASVNAYRDAMREHIREELEPAAIAPRLSAPAPAAAGS